MESNAAHPAPLSPAYRSSIKRPPQKPLIQMRHALSELTGSVYGYETRRNANDPVLALGLADRRVTMIAQLMANEPRTYQTDIRLQGDWETVFDI